MNKILLTSLLLISMLRAYSQTELIHEAIVTDRPDLTESSRTVPHRSIQIETGLLMFVEKSTDPSEFKTTLYQFPATLVRLGFFKNVELRLFNQFINEQSDNPSLPLEDRSVYGIDNLQIGTKINLTTQKGLRPEIAFLSHIVLPIGSSEFKNNKPLVNVVFSLSHTLSDKFSLGYNLGWTSDNTNENGTGTYTLALGYTISPKFSFYLEGYGLLKNLVTPTLGIDGGFTFLLNNKIQLDVSAGKSLTSHNYFLSTGFSLLIPEVF